MLKLQRYFESFEGNQTDLAKHLKITPPYLSFLLSGKRSPSLKVAARIAQVTQGAVPMESWHSAAGAAVYLDDGKERRVA